MRNKEKARREEKNNLKNKKIIQVCGGRFQNVLESCMSPCAGPEVRSGTDPGVSGGPEGDEPDGVHGTSRGGQAEGGEGVPGNFHICNQSRLLDTVQFLTYFITVHCKLAGGRFHIT